MKNRKGASEAMILTMTGVLLLGIVMVVYVLIGGGTKDVGDTEEHVKRLSATAESLGSLNVFLQLTDENSVPMREYVKKIIVEYDANIRDLMESMLDKMHTIYRFSIIFDEATIVTISKGENTKKSVFTSQEIIIDKDQTAEVHLITWH